MSLHAARSRGFTLIEVMMVVVIIAILAAVALPAYTQQVVRANRAEAMTEMVSMAQALERCFTRFSAYNNAACAIATGLGTGVSTSSGNYLITVSGLTAVAFTLTATPQGSQASRDKRCGAFTLTQAGVRGMVEVGGVTGKVEDCWR